MERGSHHAPEEIPPAPRPPMLLPEPRQAGIHPFWSQPPAFHVPESTPSGDTSRRESSDPAPAPACGTAVGKVRRCEEEGKTPATSRERLCPRQPSFGWLVWHQVSPTHGHPEQRRCGCSSSLVDPSAAFLKTPSMSSTPS